MLHFSEGSEFEGYTITEVVHHDHYKEVYYVTDKLNNKKEKMLFLIKRYQSKNSYNHNAFTIKDCLIQGIPKFTFRDSHFFPSVASQGHKEFDYFICEPFDRNIMVSFFENGNRITIETLRNYGHKMFYILSVLEKKRTSPYAFNNISPYDFYETFPKKNGKRRLIMLNQNFGDNPVPAFNSKFNSLSVMNGGKPTLVDNAISICYILLFLYYGTLPWMVTNSNSVILRLKKKFCKREISPDTPEEIAYVMSLLKQFEEQPDEDDYDFKNIAFKFQRFSGESVDSSVLDTTISPASSVTSTPVRPKKTSSLQEALESSAKKEKENLKRIRESLTLPKTVDIPEEKVPKKEQVKRIAIDEVPSKPKVEKSAKKRELWNDIKAIIVNPLLISSAILFGKFVLDTLK